MDLRAMPRGMDVPAPRERAATSTFDQEHRALALDQGIRVTLNRCGGTEPRRTRVPCGQAGVGASRLGGRWIPAPLTAGFRASANSGIVSCDPAGGCGQIRYVTGQVPAEGSRVDAI